MTPARGGTMDRVRIGVIGLGWVAQVVHLPILSHLPEAEIVAVCDRDRSRAKLVGEKFGIRRMYTDADQMLANEELHAVIVAPPPTRTGKRRSRR